MNIRILLPFLMTVVIPLSVSAQASFGTAESFNDGWKFHLGDMEEAHLPDFDDARWTETDIPHDWSVKGTYSPALASGTGYLPGGVGWYRKHFSGSIAGPDENVYIYFEGIYNRSKVYLNGHLLGERPSGYVSFMYDMTPYLDREGMNVLAVRADHSRHADSRFYTGSGIYRDTWLIKAGRTHFAQWGVGYTAEQVSNRQATLKVDAAIEGLPRTACRLVLKLKDASGAVVATGSFSASAKQTVALKVKNPHRWDVADPYLYSLEASVVSGSKTLDRTDITVGIRTLQYDADKGFALNGRWIKVKGVCLHHDAGVLGAAVPDELWWKRLRTLKSLGVNAIRTSHNQQADVFYNICDRIGLLVMDEAFDEWEFPKKKWVKGWNVGTPAMDGTADFFNEWCEADVTDMVRRDRNHPSIIMWSIGNEVDYPNDPYSHPILDGGNFEFTQPLSGGYRKDAPDAMRIGTIAKRLAACVRKIDTSRPVTGALAGVVMSNRTEYPEAVDIVGYNYTESRYDKDHATYPERVIYGSENRHDYNAWKSVRDKDFIFGQFLWTGADYLGESGRWPSRGSGAGLIDMANFIKPRGWCRMSWWSDKPMIYIGTGRSGYDIWNYDSGETVPVVCYTNGASARLLLNGKQVGETKPFDDNLGSLSWQIPFEAGTLTAEALDAEGKVTATCAITTSLRPFALKAEVDHPGLHHPGEVSIITINILDDNGNPVRLADNEITCTVSGPATLIGLEAADMSDMGNYNDNVQRAYRGRLVAYVRRNSQPGDITVRFTSPLLKSTSVKL